MQDYKLLTLVWRRETMAKHAARYREDYRETTSTEQQRAPTSANPPGIMFTYHQQQQSDSR